MNRGLHYTGNHESHTDAANILSQFVSVMKRANFDRALTSDFWGHATNGEPESFLSDRYGELQRGPFTETASAMLRDNTVTHPAMGGDSDAV